MLKRKEKQYKQIKYKNGKRGKMLKENLSIQTSEILNVYILYSNATNKVRRIDPEGLTEESISE